MCPYGRAGKLGDSRFLDRSYILWRSINLSKGSQNTILRRAKRIVRYVNIYQHLQRGAKWFRFKVSIHHPLGFNWHPFAGPGIWFYMNTHVWLGPVCISATSSPQVFLFSKKVKYEIDAKKWTQKKIEDIFLLDNLFHFRISSLIFKILCQVFQNLKFSSFGTLHSCNKKRAPEIFPVPPRGSRLDPQPGGSVVFRTLLQRNWPVLGTSGWLLGETFRYPGLPVHLGDFLEMAIISQPVHRGYGYFF